jgi:sodium-dependent dicarboxylate transporter 2/3/5
MSNRSWIGALLGVLALILFLVIPPIAPLTELGMKTIGIFLFTIIWWVSVGVGYPSLISVILLALTRVMTPTEAFANSWGHWVVLFLIGSFGLSECLRITGFSRRFALWFITRPFTAGRPWALVSMFLLANATLGAVMPLTATCVVFMAVAQPMLEALKFKKGDDFAAMLMTGIAWMSTAAAGMTPIGQTGNIMMIGWLNRDFKYSVNFIQWMLFGIPLGLLVLGTMLLIFRFFSHIDVSKISASATGYARSEMEKMGPMKVQEKVTLAVFLCVVALWMFPGIFGSVFPDATKYLSDMGFAIPPVIGACFLCLIPVEGKPVFDFKQWMWSGVEWGTIALVGTIFALGAAIAKPETGISNFIIAAFQPLVQSGSEWVLVIMTFVWTVVQTNAMSNIVTETLVYTVMVPIMTAAKVGNPIALGAVISSASNLAFSLPSATTTTAIVAGAGWVSVKFMAKYGLMMIIPCIILCALLAYPIASAVFR